MGASTRIPGLRTMGVVLAALATAAGGCEGGQDHESPPRDAAGAVRAAAVRTLAAGPASIGIDVSSSSTAYSVRGAIELAAERFRVRTRVRSAPFTHFDKTLEVIGERGETYQIIRGEPGFEDIARTGCAFDPHAAIGSLGGAVSVQEAVALVGVAARLLRDGTRAATVVEQDARPAATYRIIIDPGAVSDADAPRGDERIVVNPSRLARHLAPMHVKVDSDGLIRRLSLELRRFPPPSRGPGLAREHRRERVSIAVSLGDFGRQLEVRPPSCVAME